MTVPAIAPSVSYVENGVTTDFAVPFPYRAPSDLRATRVADDGTETTLAYGTDFTATAGSGDAGGTLSVTVAAASGKLLISRFTARSQQTDYVENGAFSAAATEGSLDRAMLIDQEQDVEIDRAPKFPIGSVPIDFAAMVNPATGDFVQYNAETNLLELTPFASSAIALAQSSVEAQAAAIDAAVASALEAFNFLLARAAAVNTIKYFVDPDSGSDANDGLSAENAFATLTAARIAAADGETIGLKRGSIYYRADFLNFYENVVGYGSSPAPATISAGQLLDGKVWVDQGGGVYKTTFTTIDAHIVGGLGSATNTTYAFVRIGDHNYEWAVGGADIAANLTALAALEGGFAINKTGDSAPDIRTGTTPGTSFDLYVRMPGGANPNGQALVTMNYAGVYSFDNELIQGVAFRDWFGKDGPGTVAIPANVPRLIEVESLGGGCHGWVGVAEAWGLKARGFARTGMNGATLGFAAGGGFNVFSSTQRDGLVLVHRGLDLDGFVHGFYGHRGGATTIIAHRHEFHPSLRADLPDFKIRNCNNGIQFDRETTNNNSVISDGVYIYCPVDCANLFGKFASMAGKLYVAGGGSVHFAEPSSNRQVYVEANGTSVDVKIKGVTLTADTDNDLGFDKNLLFVTGYYGGALPVFEIEDGTLPIGAPEDHFYLDLTAAAVDAHLIVSGATVMGDIIEMGRTQYPTIFTAERPATFAFADQVSRAAVRSLLGGAGKSHSIDNGCTLNRRDGTLAEAAA